MSPQGLREREREDAVQEYGREGKHLHETGRRRLYPKHLSSLFLTHRPYILISPSWWSLFVFSSLSFTLFVWKYQYSALIPSYCFLLLLLLSSLAWENYILNWLHGIVDFSSLRRKFYIIILRLTNYNCYCICFIVLYYNQKIPFVELGST